MSCIPPQKHRLSLSARTGIADYTVIVYYTVATSWLRSVTSPYSPPSLFDKRSTKFLTPQQIISTIKTKGRSPCPEEGVQIRLAHLYYRAT